MSYPDSGFFIADALGVVGPEGPAGATGATGPFATGPTGPVGATGPSSGTVIPSLSRTIYVTTYGNDTTGDGSFGAPYASLAKATATANSISSTSSPVVINILSGNYTENNGAGPISFTAGGISVVGAAASSVFIFPADASTNLISTTVGVQFINITFQVDVASTATCLVCSGLLNSTNLYSCRIFGFYVGVNFGGTFSSYLTQDCVFRTCSTHIIASAVTLVMNNSTIQGSATAVPAGVGIVASGAGTSLLVSSGLWVRCITMLSLGSNASIVADAVSFRNNKYDIVASSSSIAYITGCAFTYGNSSSDITVQVSDTGTSVQLLGCQLVGTNITTGLNTGSGVQVVNGGLLHVANTQITYFQQGANCGISSADTSSTVLQLSGDVFDTNDADVTQYGTATLDVSGCSIALAKIFFNDSTNIFMNFTGTVNKEFSVGKLRDDITSLIRVVTDTINTNVPILKYIPDFYGYDSMAMYNIIEPASVGAYTTLASALTAITTDRDKSSTIQLFSDTSGTIGDSSALRGWQISKTGTSGNLSFRYSNADVVGQDAIPEYTFVELDGLNEQLSLPSINSTFVIGTDTTLYRDSYNTLATSGDFIINGLTPSTALYADANNVITSSITTPTELGYLSGTTSSIQAQLNSKLSISGGTMTGALTLPVGSVGAPSLNFSGGNTSGLYFSSNAIRTSIQGVEKLNVSSSGLTIPSFSTGVVKSDSGGLLSSSLIVSSDITNSTITNAKLSSISSSDTSGAIVVRDGSGNFATNMITIDGTTANATDVATKSYVDSVATTGIVPVPPALVVSTSNVAISGLQTIDSVLLADTNRVLLVSQSTGVQNGVWLAHTGAWTRPTDANDFNTGTEAGNAYVLVTNGTLGAGSSYLCTTPTAIVDTNPITMVQFSLGGSVSNASNVGSGQGQLFTNKSGSTLNFKTLLQGNGIVLSNNSSDVSINTTATGTNTANAIVVRDASGNFSAGTITSSLIGSASLNVLKTGDTMVGNLYLPPGSIANPSLGFTGSLTTGLSANSNVLSLSSNGAEGLRLSATGVVINTLNSLGIVHTDANGYLSSSLITNADVSASAGIVDTKLNTISTAGKVLNTATTATGGNIASAIVARDASGNFSAGVITATLAGNVVGSASLNVLKAGDTMSGNLTLPAGSTSLPSLNFSGSTTSGLSASAGGLNFSTNGTGAFQITSAGVVVIPQFTIAGVVHNDGSGNLTSSSIVNADISASAGIVDTKLDTIASIGKVLNSATTATGGNIPNAIVARDVAGNFSAGVITANSIVVSGITSTGTFIASTGSASNPSYTFLGSLTTGLFGSSNALSLTANAGERMRLSSTGVLINAFTATGIVHNDNNGYLTTSLITNVDVDSSANIADTKLNTISTSGKVLNSATTATGTNTANAIVSRDASGNFSAGTITASLIGSASLNVLKAGDLMSGTLYLPPGAVSTPSLGFTGSLTTGLSANSNALSLSANAGERMRLSSTGVLINAFTATGIVHNDNSGYLTTSLITNADVSNSAGIVDTKLNTISTSGKVLNSATTATGTNTANAIVVRDASGNFSAGTITASLSGNASTVTTNANMTGAFSSVGNTGALRYIEVSATGATTVATTTDTLMSGMTTTPEAGVYLVLFNTVVSNGNNRTITATVYIDSNPQITSVRTVQTTSATDFHTMVLNEIVSVNGAQTVAIYWKTSTATATCNQRSLILLRLV